MLGRRGLMVATALAAALAAGGCSTVAEGGRTGGDALHRHLLALETGSWQYVKERNQAAMRDFLADDVLLVFGDGSRFDKAQYVASLADQTLTGLKIEEPRTLPISPDVAALIYKVTYTSAMKTAAPVTMTSKVSSTYVLRNGRWLSVLYQETPIR